MSKPNASELDSQAQWVASRQFSLFMHGWNSTQVQTVVLWAVTVGLMWYFTPGVRTALWTLLSLAVGGARFRTSRTFSLRLKNAEAGEQLAFMHRYRWLPFAYALCWGVTPMVFVGFMPMRAEAVCWSFTLGVVAVFLWWSASRLEHTKVVLGAFLLTLLASLAWRALEAPQLIGVRITIWQPLFLLVYGGVVWSVAKAFNQTYTESIDLRYHNERLIESLRAQNQAAVEAVRFKDRFLASAAHDLKQPVNALGIYAEWLASEPELAHELSLKILKSTQSVNALFDSLFDFVRLDAGKMQVRQRTIKLAELFDDLEVQFRPTALEKSLNLRVRPKAWTLHTDPIMLQRILSNLLANAMRYTSHGGALLAVRPWRGGLRLEVWDTGIGVAENQLGHIFAEFYKVQSAGTQEGFGLGLAIVKRLTEALGYELQVRSREGRGTLFRITLPPDAVVAAPELRTTATRASGRSAASVSGS